MCEVKSLGTVRLETERLILRRFQLSDVSDMFTNWATDKKYTRYLAWEVHKNEEETQQIIKKWISDYANGFYNWAIELKSTSQVIGGINAVNVSFREKNVEVAYCIGSKFWNNGYCTEALKRVINFFFEECNFHLVEADFAISNTQSGRVMEKAGMKKDALLRERHFDEVTGTFQDVVIYSIVKN